MVRYGLIISAAATDPMTPDAAALLLGVFPSPVLQVRLLSTRELTRIRAQPQPFASWLLGRHGSACDFPVPRAAGHVPSYQAHKASEHGHGGCHEQECGHRITSFLSPFCVWVSETAPPVPSGPQPFPCDCTSRYGGGVCRGPTGPACGATGPARSAGPFPGGASLPGAGRDLWRRARCRLPHASPRGPSRAPPSRRSVSRARRWRGGLRRAFVGTGALRGRGAACSGSRPCAGSTAAGSSRLGPWRAAWCAYTSASSVSQCLSDVMVVHSCDAAPTR